MAALLVMLFHDGMTYFPIYSGVYVGNRQSGPDWFDFGHAGVDFFFVLSGFIIFWVHEADFDRPRQLFRYALRRLVRIYPTYWAALALVVAGYLLQPQLGAGRGTDPSSILLSALLVPLPHLPVLAQAWTLPYELLFYFLFALLIVKRRIGLAAFALWLAVILALDSSSLYRTYPYSFFGDIHNAQFFLGIGAGMILRRRTVPWPRLLAALGAVLFLANGMAEVTWAQVYPEQAAPFGMRPYGDVSQMIYALASMLLILGLVEAERQGHLRFPAPFVLMGEASYSIYLINSVALSASARLLKGLGLPGIVSGWPAFILLAAMALGAGLIFHLLIERPVMKYGNAWAGRLVNKRSSRT